MMNAKISDKFRRLAEHAVKVRSDDKLRHAPNAHGLQEAHDNSETMICAQFQTVKIEKEKEKGGRH